MTKCVENAFMVNAFTAHAQMDALMDISANCVLRNVILLASPMFVISSLVFAQGDVSLVGMGCFVKVSLHSSQFWN